MDFTTAGPAQNAWLWPSQDAMKTSREAKHDQDQHSPGQQQPLRPSDLDHEAKLPTALASWFDLLCNFTENLPCMPGTF